MTVISGENDSPKASVNWGAGIRGIAAAWVLASTGLWYHSALPFFAAGLVVAFALFVPLRIGRILFSQEFARFSMRTALLVVAVTAAAFPASLAANSRQPTVAALGSVLIIGLLTTVAAILLKTVATAASRSLPRLTPFLQAAGTRAQGWIALAGAAIRGARIFG